MRVGCWLPSALLWLVATDASASRHDPPVAASLAIDSTNARVEFDVAALWILHRRGYFGDIDGKLEFSADGQSARFDVRLRVDSVQMKDPDHVALLLSPDFFDAARHPWIEFRSDAFALSGATRLALPGTLTVRGIIQRVQFDVDLGDCRPGLPQACTVIVDGALQRSRFGMLEYRRTLADKVYLKITAELTDASP
jgi:polyisoprenoid-binding protein YceI